MIVHNLLAARGATPSLEFRDPCDPRLRTLVTRPSGRPVGASSGNNFLRAVRTSAAICATALPAFGAAPSPPDTPPAPGTLIERTPITGAPANSSAWRIKYRSLAEDGRNVEITGVAFVPSGAAPPGRDILAWAHGTFGIAEACAPSESPQLFVNIPGLATLIEHGDIVVATDFEGLGTKGPHPYLVGVSSARAVIDSVRAARQLPNASASKRYIVWGESQGAHAALWVGQIAKSYAPDLALVGIVAAAPPTDLIANFTHITSTAAHALLTSYTTASWSKVYGIQLSSFANFFGRYVIRHLAADCVHKEPVAAAAKVGILLLSNQIPYRVSEDWSKLLKQNSVVPHRLDVPLMIAQGTSDEIVIPEITRDFALASCRAGSPLRYLRVQGGGHTTIAADSRDQTLSWIAARFKGDAPESDCKAIETMTDGH